jgi:hypothetical protein
MSNEVSFSDKKNTADLAVGDWIHAPQRAYESSSVKTTVLQITGITKTQFTTSDGSRWLRRCGRKVGDTSAYNYAMAYPLTEERYKGAVLLSWRTSVASKVSSRTMREKIDNCKDMQKLKALNAALSAFLATEGEEG